MYYCILYIRTRQNSEWQFDTMAAPIPPPAIPLPVVLPTESTRRRRDSWSQKETLLLAQLYQELDRVTKGNLTVCTARRKANARRDVTWRLPEAFPRDRNVRLAEKWQSIQAVAKTNISACKQTLVATGKKYFLLLLEPHKQNSSSIKTRSKFDRDKSKRFVTHNITQQTNRKFNLNQQYLQQTRSLKLVTNNIL